MEKELIMSVTVIGAFDSWQDASQFKQALIKSGFAESAIRTTPSNDKYATSTHLGEEDKGFWQNLKEAFGTDEETRHEAGYYAEATRRGSTLVQVEAPENQAVQVTQLMRQYRAVDVQGRAEQWKKAGWTGYQENAAPLTADQIQHARKEDAAVVPVVEEQLSVGKRTVEGGGVRIIRRVTERPVEEQVTLRKENVDVQRHAVDRELTGAEANTAFTDKTIELTETNEEAVVAKTARVVEEVEINRDVQQKTETVRDTVRRTDVDVEKVPVGTTSNTTTDTTRTTGTTQSRERRND
jgi:stress response protein YsnF